jgi:pimeloyl-ACP methyl ester carboxylesterase
VIDLEERWTEVDGTRIFYRAADADGPPLIHVHGFAISGSYLLPTARLLARDYTTYVPDLPGYGRSDSPPRALDIPGLADALMAFMDAIGVERANFIGNSMGCSVISSVARRHSERIDHAVLVSPAGGPHNMPFAKGAAQLLLDGLREPPSMLRAAIPDYIRFGPLNAVTLLQALVQYPTLDRFLTMDTPTLAVLGSRDPLQPSRARVEEIAKECADWLSVAVIRGAPHAVNYGHADELAVLVRAFLERDGFDADAVRDAQRTQVVQVSRHLLLASRLSDGR